MKSDLKHVIAASSFKMRKGKYVYAKVNSVPSDVDYFLLTNDGEEITVIAREEALPKLELLERNKDNYALIALNVSVPFYSIGFLAVVSGAIADAGMNILIVSTYSKDYILVRYDQLKKTEEVLLLLGLKKS